MNGELLRAWRARLGLELALIAVTLGHDVALIERIEAGEVEPELELAIRLHVMTAGEVPLSLWPTLRGAVVPIATIAAKGLTGEWGVAVIAAGVQLAWMDLRAASAFELGISSAIHAASGAAAAP